MTGRKEKVTKDPIIEKPQAQDKKQRLAQVALTGAFWFFFLYLLRPFFTLIAWLVGGFLFSHEMVEKQGLQELGNVLVWYGLVILVMGSVLRTWVWYNQKRFGTRNKRRTFPHSVSIEKIAAFNQVDPESAACWQQAKTLLIHHDSKGTVVEVVVKEFYLADRLPTSEKTRETKNFSAQISNFSDTPG
jgi:poly-beta-1,6-N-acetyl-D-glucosamine biosynthesis protein PgaD